MKKPDVEFIDLDKIDISISNVRKAKLEEDIDLLARSIDNLGLQQPVVVCERNGRFELLIGQRRYLAVKRLGWPKILAMIVKQMNRAEAVIMSLSENIHRLKLEYEDKQKAAIQLLKEFKTINKVADKIGVTPQTVRNWLGYSQVPQAIKKRVDEGKLSPTTALRIWRNIPDENQAIKVAEEVIEITRSEDKDKYISLAKEDPSKSPKKIRRMMEGMVKIEINITGESYKALKEISGKYSVSVEATIVEIIESWLKEKDLM